MTILELEQRTQMERATIRYYEREGLISPSRKENSYRDYSEEDADEILKIKLLRQLDLSIDTIKQLQQGSASMNDVLRQQAFALENQIAATQRAAQICKEISGDEVTYKNLDAAHYLDKLQQSSESESKPASWHSYREYHPVRRFIARIADYYLLEAIVRFALIVILRVRPFGNLLSVVVTYGCLLLSVPLQALLLHLFGTTPGKWLMGIRVQSYYGRKLDMNNAIQREWHALLYGYGLGIPAVRLWRLYRSYKAYRDNEHLEQDIGVDHIYSYWDIFWNVWRKSAFAVFCAIIVAINCINAMDIIRPKHRGINITVAEFAENFNYYAKILKYDFSMNPDGTWYVSPGEAAGNVVVIEMSKPEKQNEPLRFETEGERVTRITYQNSWSEIIFFTPLDTRLLTACCTTVASQKGLGVNDISNVLKLIDKYQGDETVQIQYENIEIIWVIESENCRSSNGNYCANDDTMASSVTLSFEIIIH